MDAVQIIEKGLLALEALTALINKKI